MKPVISKREFDMAFRMRVGRATMTATVINLRQGCFLVTARHGVETFPSHSIELFREGSWRRINAEPVEDPKVDFSYDVVALRISDPLLSQPFTEILFRTDFFVSQDMYFLGFPLNLATDAPNGFATPIALVKKAVFSGIRGSGPFQIMFLDAMNTKGFSGGPVFVHSPRGESLGLAGIVARYEHRTVKIPVEVKDRNGVTIDTHGIVTIEENVGITIAYSIEGIVEAIKAKYG